MNASNGAVLDVSWDMRRNIRPWNKSLYIRCLRFLREGDQIAITFGDQSAGSPGWLLQTFCESAFTFQITVDPFATQDFIALPPADNPTIAMVPDVPANWKAVLPTLRRPNETFRLSIKGDDKWGNPSNLLEGPVRVRSNVSITNLPDTVSFDPGSFGAVIENLSVAEPCVIDLQLFDAAGKSLAGPIRWLFAIPRSRIFGVICTLKVAKRSALVPPANILTLRVTRRFGYCWSSGQ